MRSRRACTRSTRPLNTTLCGAEGLSSMTRAALLGLVIGVTLGISSTMAQQSIIRRGVTSYPGFDVAFQVSGEVYFLSNLGCWALVLPEGDALPMELEGLPAEFRIDGLRVVATGHLEQGKTSECIPPFKLIIDQISRAQ